MAMIGGDIINTALLVQPNTVIALIYKQTKMKFYFTTTANPLNQILET